MASRALLILASLTLILDVATAKAALECGTVLSRGSGEITALATNHTGDRIATASVNSSDGRHSTFTAITVWNQSGEALAKNVLDRTLITALAFDPTARAVAAGDSDGVIYLMTADNQSALKSSPPSTNTVQVADHSDIFRRRPTSGACQVISFSKKQLIAGTNTGCLVKADYRVHSNKTVFLGTQNALLNTSSSESGAAPHPTRFIDAKSGLVLSAGESSVLIHNHFFSGGKPEFEKTVGIPMLSEKFTPETVTAISRLDNSSIFAIAGNYGSIRFLDTTTNKLLDWRFTLPHLRPFLTNPDHRIPRLVVKELLYSAERNLLIAVGFETVRINNLIFKKIDGVRFIAIDLLRGTLKKDWFETFENRNDNVQNFTSLQFDHPVAISADRKTLFFGSLKAGSIFRFQVEQLFDFADRKETFNQ